MAKAEIHYRELTLPNTVEGLAPVTLWAVHVRETVPPEGEKLVEWLLLTSVRVERIETAVDIIGHYLRRWRVEDFFRVLKSGCCAEHLGFHSAERLQRTLTIQTVIAWRLMLMTLLGREVPECDAELLFTDIEFRFLADYAADSGLSAPDTLAGAVLLVALLGGCQNRKHDPPPGHQIMWRGVRTPLHRHPRLSGWREAPRSKQSSGSNTAVRTLIWQFRCLSKRFDDIRSPLVDEYHLLPERMEFIRTEIRQLPNACLKCFQSLTEDDRSLLGPADRTPIAIQRRIHKTDGGGKTQKVCSSFQQLRKVYDLPGFNLRRRVDRPHLDCGVAHACNAIPKIPQISFRIRAASNICIDQQSAAFVNVFLN